MNDIKRDAAEMLTAAGFTVKDEVVEGKGHLVFESATVLGFLVAYDGAASLIADWAHDTRRVIEHHRLALRRGGQKAWNTYVVLLAADAPIEFEAVALATIEEDLSGTRKIARAGIGGVLQLKEALLPLLPFQSAPRLEAIDSIGEIEQRITALDTRIASAFLSSVSPSVLFSLIEETP